MPARLDATTLRGLAGRAALPAYDRARVTNGIVHLGIGAFHRAHQAVYVDDCLAAGETDWGIVGVSMRGPATRDALASQDGLYTVSALSAAGEDLRVIGSVREVLVAPENPAALLARLADPAIRIVSLTVTEKAYLRESGGGLDRGHPDILADLADPGRPRTAPGILVEALARRRAAGTAPFTVLTCDNLPANGETLHALLADYADLRGGDLVRFVEEEVACPSTMVDRIVPATTDADRARISARLGVEDAWPVVTEPFTQWVVEDRFPAGRPALEAAGVEMVASVTAHEHMKLRLLNGSHSAMAYVGLIAGRTTVSEAFADPAIRRFVDGVWAEAIPTLETGAGLDAPAYVASLAGRYANPALAHRLAQIANDGSQKLPQRIVATALERIAVGAPVDHLAMTLAAFIRAALARGRDLPAGLFADPLDGRLAALDPAAPPADLVRAVFAAAGFAEGADGRAGLEAAVARRLADLAALGPAAALARLAT